MADIVNIDYVSEMVFKWSQKHTVVVEDNSIEFLLFGEHNRSIIVENCEHNLELQ